MLIDEAAALYRYPLQAPHTVANLKKTISLLVSNLLPQNFHHLKSSVNMVVQGLPINGVEDVLSLNVPSEFSMVAVDGRRGDTPTDHSKGAQNQSFIMKSEEPPPSPSIFFHPDDDSTLGNVLSKFVGTFRYVCSSGAEFSFS